MQCVSLPHQPLHLVIHLQRESTEVWHWAGWILALVLAAHHHCTMIVECIYDCRQPVQCACAEHGSRLLTQPTTLTWFSYCVREERHGQDYRQVRANLAWWRAPEAHQNDYSCIRKVSENTNCETDLDYFPRTRVTRCRNLHRAHVHGRLHGGPHKITELLQGQPLASFLG